MFDNRSPCFIPCRVLGEMKCICKYSYIYIYVFRVLREMKCSLEVECEQIKRKFENTINDNNLLVREYAVHRGESDKEMSQLRAELKIKTFELTVDICICV
jgi:hypothetical protein